MKAQARAAIWQTPKKAWARILAEAEIENLRIHDLRRTLGSYQAATGANGYIIGKSLGHRSQQSTAIYARLNLDPVRDSVNKATDAMFGYVNSGSSAIPAGSLEITIDGRDGAHLPKGTNIKILDTAGNLVFETIAEGTQAVWNGNNMNGQRVATGVYLVFGIDTDGNDSQVAKVLFTQ